jgi:two-component system sensor histidine kinase BaeS
VKGLFGRNLLAFLAALLILIAMVTLVFFLGFSMSLREWSRDKSSEVQGFARDLLMGKPVSGSIPEETTFVVYDAAGNLIYSNRGPGRIRQIEERELLSVEQGGEVLGSYYAGTPHFRNDAANDRFIRSMTRVVWVSLLGAFVLSLLFSLLLSKSLSAPSRRVAAGLDRMSRGDLESRIPEEGATEIAQIAAAANRLSRRLAKEQELRRQWAEDIAHDLRTPVTALKAQFEGMRDGVLDISAHRIDKNIREIQRIESLVLDLEELTRLESPEQALKMGPVKAEELLGDLRERFSMLMERKKVRWEFHTEIEALELDEALMQRALSNILSNAVRHVDEGGEVELRILRRGDEAVLLIRNTGDTIPEADIPKLFDRLYRGEKARTSPGSGLGLTIARQIVDLHKGRITVESTEAEGTLVTIILPAGSCGTGSCKAPGG